MKHISKLIKCALNDYRLVVGKIKSPAACVGVVGDGVVVDGVVDGVDVDGILHGVGIVGVVIVIFIFIAYIIAVVVLIANDVFVVERSI